MAKEPLANRITVGPHGKSNKQVQGATRGHCDIWLDKAVMPDDWKEIPKETPCYISIHQPFPENNGTGIVLMWTDLPKPKKAKGQMEWRSCRWYVKGGPEEEGFRDHQIRIYLRRKILEKLEHPVPLGHYEAQYQVLTNEEDPTVKVWRIIAFGYYTLMTRGDVIPPRTETNKLWVPGMPLQAGGPPVFVPPVKGLPNE